MECILHILQILNPIAYMLVSGIWYWLWRRVAKDRFALERRVATLEMWARLNDVKLNPPRDDSMQFWDQPWNNPHQDEK